MVGKYPKIALSLVATALIGCGRTRMDIKPNYVSYVGSRPAVEIQKGDSEYEAMSKLEKIQLTLDKLVQLEIIDPSFIKEIDEVTFFADKDTQSEEGHYIPILKNIHVDANEDIERVLIHELLHHHFFEILSSDNRDTIKKLSPNYAKAVTKMQNEFDSSIDKIDSEASDVIKSAFAEKYPELTPFQVTVATSELRRGTRDFARYKTYVDFMNSTSTQELDFNHEFPNLVAWDDQKSTYQEIFPILFERIYYGTEAHAYIGDHEAELLLWYASSEARARSDLPKLEAKIKQWPKGSMHHDVLEAAYNSNLNLIERAKARKDVIKSIPEEMIPFYKGFFHPRFFEDKSK